MSNRIAVKVTLPTDAQGMIGRECPKCRQYFKLKPGTGLQTSICACPYCEYEADGTGFATEDQIEYAKSVAIRQVVGPMLKDLARSFQDLERKTRGGLIQFKVRATLPELPIEYYSERDLETLITCDSCELRFAIYGVFARCPDCKRLTTMSIFAKSLEVTRKRLGLLDNIPEDKAELREALLADSLSACIAAFDGLGKRLRKEQPSLLPTQPHNLFQNLDALNDVLIDAISKNLEQIAGPDKCQFLYRMFQVRHIWEHNFGEIDERFIEKTGCPVSLLRTKYELTREEVADLIDLIEDVGMEIHSVLTSVS